MIALQLALVFVVSAVSLTASWAQSSVWTVKSGDDLVYVGGTVHVLRSSDYPLPAEFGAAYADADRVLFETDIGRLKDPAVQQMIRSSLRYEDGRTLARVLSPGVYGALEKYAQVVGVSLSRFEAFRPVMVLLGLLAAELERAGASAKGIDEYFYGLALSDGKSVGSLEAVERQVEVLISMGEGDEDTFVIHGVAELKETGVMLEQAIAAWRSGDTGRLAALLVERMRREYPAIYRELIVERNQDWLPRVERLFNEPGKEFLLVGVAHLVGKDGLLSQLEQAGYEVRRLETGGKAWGG